MARTSASHAWGSTSLSFAVPIREYMMAARWPPRSDPAKSQDLRPRAIPRRARSAALLERSMRPSSRKRVKPDHRLRWLQPPGHRTNAPIIADARAGEVETGRPSAERSANETSIIAVVLWDNTSAEPRSGKSADTTTSANPRETKRRPCRHR
jgi:hypothetical protein